MHLFLRHFSRHVLRHVAATLCSLLATAQVLAAQAGWRQVDLPGAAPDDTPIKVALYYPTQAPARSMAMGPFTVRVAVQAAPDAAFKGLIVLSHGTGGSELGHTSLAEALAQHGYLVAALRHPGDNWQDRSLLQQGGAARYFMQRPRHVSRVIDALLRDPAWSGRIASDARGPRIGAVGHSAGGYTVLALAGGQADLARIGTHCGAHRADDPVFCGMGRTGNPADSPSAPPPAIAALTDARVRAVVALSPVGVVFSARSLAAISIPTALYAAEKDRVLVPRFHAEWIAGNLPGAEFHRVPGAGHYAFMDAPGVPIASEDGDIGADPPGFDRRAFLVQLQHDLPLFFDAAFH